MARIYDYHVRARWGVPRRAARWLVAITALAVVIWAATTWVPELQRYLQHRRLVRAALLAQRVCMEFSLPPATIVYSDDPADIASPGAGRYWTFSSDLHGQWYEGETPRQRIARQTDEWRALAFAVASARLGTQGLSQYPLVAFMHHRRSPGGHDRLVVIETGEWGCLQPIVVTPFTAETPPVLGPCLRQLTLWRRFSRPLRIFAGQPDANDLSHFTFDYTYDGRRGTIEAYLDDNDGVRFQLSSVPPSTTWPTWFFLDRVAPATAPSPASAPALNPTAN